jgi:hypothetical protein
MQIEAPYFVNSLQSEHQQERENTAQVVRSELTSTYLPSQSDGIGEQGCCKPYLQAYLMGSRLNSTLPCCHGCRQCHN